MQVAPTNHVELLKREGTDWLTPDMRPEIIADINDAPTLKPYKDELVHGARAQFELALLRQARIKESEDRIERAYVDGLGAKIASIDTHLFLRLEQCWGRGWWRDRRVLNQVLHDNPFLAVRAAPSRVFRIRI